MSLARTFAVCEMMLHRHRCQYKARSILHLSILLSQHFSGCSFRQSDLSMMHHRAGKCNSSVHNCNCIVAFRPPLSLSLSVSLPPCLCDLLSVPDTQTIINVHTRAQPSSKHEPPSTQFTGHQSSLISATVGIRNL